MNQTTKAGTLLFFPTLLFLLLFPGLIIGLQILKSYYFQVPEESIVLVGSTSIPTTADILLIGFKSPVYWITESILCAVFTFLAIQLLKYRLTKAKRKRWLLSGFIVTLLLGSLYLIKQLFYYIAASEKYNFKFYWNETKSALTLLVILYFLIQIPIVYFIKKQLIRDHL